MKNNETYIKEVETEYVRDGFRTIIKGKKRFDSKTNLPVLDNDLDDAFIEEADRQYRLFIGFDGKKIKSLRKKLDMTQQEFAGELGISRKTLILLEKNVYLPNKSTLILLKNLQKESLNEKYGFDLKSAELVLELNEESAGISKHVKTSNQSIVSLNQRNHVTMPKSIRKKLNLKPNDRFEVIIENNKIVFKPIKS